jgi:glycosyltransferase involved in cell wall biosynthesis
LAARTPAIDAPVATADRVQPVRLLKVVPTLMSGGTEGQVMNLCRSLDPGQFSLELACLRRIGPYVQEVAAQRIPLTEYRIASFRSAGTFVQQSKFVRHLSRHGTQIVHAYNFYGNVFAIPPARLARVPVVIASIRDLGLYLTPMQKRVQRYVCRLADCVLVNADAVKRWLVEDGYDAAKILVIRNGVDLGRFSRPPEPDRIRGEFGVPRRVPLVAVVSRLNRLKGLEQFLETAAVVSSRFPEARFLVVGETPPHDPTYLDDLKTLARDLGIGSRVIFTGLRADVPAFLASVDVAVMPSLNEALSNALLEAMAAGAPVVATRVGGTAEALVDGETGLLVAPDDVVSLAAAVVRLLEAPALAAQLGRAARQMIADRFSIARMAADTERLYHELLTHTRDRRSIVDLGNAVRVPPSRFARRRAAPTRSDGGKSDATYANGRSQWSEHSQL